VISCFPNLRFDSKFATPVIMNFFDNETCIARLPRGCYRDVTTLGVAEFFAPRRRRTHGGDECVAHSSLVERGDSRRGGAVR
jgi:hypothetical protein